jgi:DNA-directed RNA polymerase specialized sigma24 family protein
VRIAGILNRNSKTVWATYSKAVKKLPKKFDVKEDNVSVPLSIIKNREYSVLESIVGYLKEEHELSYQDISELLGRAYKTIATVYRRYKLKKNKI